MRILEHWYRVNVAYCTLYFAEYCDDHVSVYLSASIYLEP